MSVQFAESKPSVADLASFASRAKDIDIGGGDDIVELGDNLGLNLMANPNKISPSPRSQQKQVSFGSPSGSTSDMPQIQIKPIDDFEVVNLDAAPGVNDIHINKTDDTPFVINTGSSLEPQGMGMGSGSGSGLTPEQEATEKQKYLTKLRRLEANDIRGARMSMSNSLADIKAEHDRLTDSRNLEASIRFQRNALMTFVTGVEMVNDKLGHRLPVKPRLKGWSESVHTNVEDFDEIFEELYDLYKDSAKMHPLMRLVGTLGVSATMYHLTNSMAERSGIPGMADLLNENPELQRQFAQAAAAKMGGGLGSFMNAASGFGPRAPSVPPPAPIGMPFMDYSSGSGTRGVPFNVASAAMDQPSAAPAVEAAPKVRREMRGPHGVDDILKAFEAERMMQEKPAIASQHSTVFTPSGPPPTPPRAVNIVREGVGTSSDPLSEFGISSSGASDAQSVGTDNTMNTERRRGRRRAAAAPVGATLSLNV